MSVNVTSKELETAVLTFNDNPTMIGLRRSLLLFLVQNVKAFIICNRKFLMPDRVAESFYEVSIQDEAGKRGTLLFHDDSICVTMAHSDFPMGNLFVGHFDVRLGQEDEKVLHFAIPKLIEVHLFVGWPSVIAETVN